MKELFLQHMTSRSQTFEVEIPLAGEVELTVDPPSSVGDWKVEMWHVDWASSPTPRPAPTVMPTAALRPPPTATSVAVGASHVSLEGTGLGSKSQKVAFLPGRWSVTITDDSEYIITFRAVIRTQHESKELFNHKMTYASETFYLEITEGDEVEFIVIAPPFAGDWTVEMWRVGTLASPTSTAIPSPAPTITPRPSPSPTPEPPAVDTLTISGVGGGYERRTITLQPGRWSVEITDDSGRPSTFRVYVYTSKYNPGTVIADAQMEGSFDVPVGGASQYAMVDIGPADWMMVEVFASDDAGNWAVFMQLIR